MSWLLRLLLFGIPLYLAGFFSVVLLAASLDKWANYPISGFLAAFIGLLCVTLLADWLSASAALPPASAQASSSERLRRTGKILGVSVLAGAAYPFLHFPPVWLQIAAGIPRSFWTNLAVGAAAIATAVLAIGLCYLPARKTD